MPVLLILMRKHWISVIKHLRYLLADDLHIGCGAWAGRIGEVAFRELREWLESDVYPFVDAKEWNHYEWADFCERWIEEAEVRQSFWRARIFWAKKVAEPAA